MRINRYLAACGVCSRRDADRLIEEGRVTVDGHTAKPGDRVEDGVFVLLDGRRLLPVTEHGLYLYYKPRGVVCTDRDAHAKRTLAGELENHPALPKGRRLLYIGRLDKESEGLLLLTDDSRLKRALESAESGIEKEYLVETDVPLSGEAVQRLEKGVYLSDLNLSTRPCRIRRTDDLHFRITLTEGKNRQIRRMCLTEGVQVKRLVRVREGCVLLGSMKPGDLAEADESVRRQLYQEAELS